jgi:transcriptional regulator with XRE-family HTH domain
LVCKHSSIVVPMQSESRPPGKQLTPPVVFGRVLAEIRVAAGLSQEELAFRSGYHRTYISLLERGLKNPSLNTLLAVAKPLNVRASDMVKRVEASL